MYHRSPPFGVEVVVCGERAIFVHPSVFYVHDIRLSARRKPLRTHLMWSTKHMKLRRQVRLLFITPARSITCSFCVLLSLSISYFLCLSVSLCLCLHLGHSILTSQSLARSLSRALALIYMKTNTQRELRAQAHSQRKSLRSPPRRQQHQTQQPFSRQSSRACSKLAKTPSRATSTSLQVEFLNMYICIHACTCIMVFVEMYYLLYISHITIH